MVLATKYGKKFVYDGFFVLLLWKACNSPICRAALRTGNTDINN